MSKSKKARGKAAPAKKKKADEFDYSPLDAAQRKQKRGLLKTPVKQITVGKGMKAADMLAAMSGMSIQARNLGQCAEVLDGMYSDKARPTVFLGLAGPLIAAGLRNVIRDLIVGGYVDVVVSTGAIMYQDIYQARGFKHFRGTPQSEDPVLRELRIDRIYDTYVDEEAFWATDKWCSRVADKLVPGNYSSRYYMNYVGSQLKDENSIVRQCHKHGVPIFVPAINDSSIGIGLTDHRYRCIREGRRGICIDSIQDNYEIAQVVVKSKKTAAFYVAGGVPKNYINDAVVMGYIFGLERGHAYALQVTTAVTQDGGLSGSTLAEAQSWGKIQKKADFAMAWVEPSVSLPLLAAYAMDRYPAPARKRLRFDWDGEILKSVKI